MPSFLLLILTGRKSRLISSHHVTLLRSIFRLHFKSGKRERERRQISQFGIQFKVCCFHCHTLFKELRQKRGQRLPYQLLQHFPLISAHFGTLFPLSFHKSTCFCSLICIRFIVDPFSVTLSAFYSARNDRMIRARMCHLAITLSSLGHPFTSAPLDLFVSCIDARTVDGVTDYAANSQIKSYIYALPSFEQAWTCFHNLPLSRSRFQRDSALPAPLRKNSIFTLKPFRMLKQTASFRYQSNATFRANFYCGEMLLNYIAIISSSDNVYHWTFSF
jgi:hypothetical protein